MSKKSNRFVTNNLTNRVKASYQPMVAEEKPLIRRDVFLIQHRDGSRHESGEPCMICDGNKK